MGFPSSAFEELLFLSGGNTSLRQRFAIIGRVGFHFPRTLPQVKKSFSAFPKTLRSAIGIAAALGGCAPISFILKVAIFERND